MMLLLSACQCHVLERFVRRPFPFYSSRVLCVVYPLVALPSGFCPDIRCGGLATSTRGSVPWPLPDVSFVSLDTASCVLLGRGLWACF